MPDRLTISVVVPAQNEQHNIEDLLRYLKSTSQTKAVEQIIVAVNGDDQTAKLARKAGAQVVTVGASRSVALNGGQKIATGNILYFLHADSRPPLGWDAQIIDAYHAGYRAGTFRLSFDSNNKLLRLSAWFTRFNWKFIRFGDQSLFVGQTEFIKAGKYNQAMQIMEDREIINRIYVVAKFKVLPSRLITSARKYQRYGFWRLQTIYVIVNILYYLRLPQDKLVLVYKKLLGS